MRPELTKKTKESEFRIYYWLKEELQDFCRKNGIRASGSKQELTDRIAAFLETGEVQKPLRQRAHRSSKRTEPELSLDTVITEHHRCSQAVRAFLQSVIPNFHFSTFIQTYFREHAGNTYRDAVKAWHEEAERKKNPAYKTDIAPQFEYNRFIRDFFDDPSNKGKSREEAIQEWKGIKKCPGSNKYVPKNKKTT